MEEKAFVWTPELNKRLIQFRIDHDWLFKTKKQPWGEFYKILIDRGFPMEMTINHVRKKWSYMYDSYKIAKKAKNKKWKYYKMFEKLYGRTKILDKYESWSDEWRLKLIASISAARYMTFNYRKMWKSVEISLRSEELPVDCCIQDIKGLWQHLRTTFNRKHRIKLKKGAELTDWLPYESMANFFYKFEPEYLTKVESESGNVCMSRQRKSSKHYLNKSEKSAEHGVEFQWSKDITESFIQIRLQNDWLFRERKWAWNDLLAIMHEEYGFPRSLTGRDICRKWASTFSEYQKAKATNNKLWVYHKLFEVYLGEGNLSLDPTIGWEQEWIFNLINIRGDHENLFICNLKDQTHGWREVEKQLRKLGLPLDHSLLELPEVWAYLVKTFRWKRKFADKGILNEQWPFYDAMVAYTERHDSARTKIEQKQETPEQEPEPEHYEECAPSDDEVEEDMKLTDLQQKIHVLPKVECLDVNNCRACYEENGCVNIFSTKDDEGVVVAEKLRVICGVEVDAADKMPSQICLECARALEFAYKFRRKCLDSDAKFKSEEVEDEIKIEVVPDVLIIPSMTPDHEQVNFDPGDGHFDDPPSEPETMPEKKTPDRKPKTPDGKPKTPDRKPKTPDRKPKTPDRKPKTPDRKPQTPKPKKKVFKLKYHYWKVCEVCGKYTKNLMSHLDTHSISKEHACNVCDKKFKFRSGLLIHRAVHDPTPKKTCEVCGKTFHVLAQYRKHFVYHANERKYSCDTCGKRFNTLDILRVHNRIHTDERPFACDECGKTFRTAGCVSRHKRIVHRNVKVY